MGKLGFGKYANLELCDVPEDYLLWLRASSLDKVKMIDGELERRTNLEEASMGMIDRIIATGYRELAKRLHPDHGGNGEEMKELNASFNKLKQARKGS